MKAGDDPGDGRWTARIQNESESPSVEALDRLADIGIEPAGWVEQAMESLKHAGGQIDAVLAEAPRSTLAAQAGGA